MSGANNRTLNVDSLFVRNIYFKDYANNPIPANQLLVSRGDGGTYFGNLPYSTNSTFYQAINEVDAPTADGGTYRLVASTTYNTLLLEPGAGMQFYSNSQTGGLIVYNTGPEQIVAGGQSLPFSTLTDELVGGRTLFFQGKNDINVYISDTTVVFDSISNTNLSTIVELQSTSIGLEQEFSTTNGYLNSSINTINVLFYSTNLFYLTSTLNAQYAIIGGLSTYFFVPNQINISTVSTTNLTINQNVIRDIALNNSIYDPCAVYANNTVISTNTDFLTFTDEFTDVTFAIDKEYLFASSTLRYGPSTTTVTKGQQVQLGWFPGISTQGSNTQSLRSQFVPVVQQMQVIEYIVSTNNVSTIANYYLQNIGKFDKICSPSNLILAASNVYTSSIYLSTINGLSVLANGSNYGDYLFWNGSSWAIGYSTIRIGDRAGSITQGEAAVAIGAAAGQSNQSTGAVAIGQQAGQSTQQFWAVAVGYQAGQYAQSNQGIAMGFQAGQSNQGSECIAIGTTAGGINQTNVGIAIGSGAGEQNQNGGIAIGFESGLSNQSGIAIGNSAGCIIQSTSAIAIGNSAGYQNQMPNAIAIGFTAGRISQKDNSIAIGTFAGFSNQSPSSISIGYAAGSNNQSNNSVAIGYSAGQSTQGAFGVAIGSSAGQITQGSNTVAIGNSAGRTNQSSNAVAIGYAAGLSNQGSNAVAIGYAAGSNNQSTNTIVINASGVTLNTSTANAFYVAPIRSDNTQRLPLAYNTVTKEIVTTTGNQLITDYSLPASVTSPAFGQTWILNRSAPVGVNWYNVAVSGTGQYQLGLVNGGSLYKSTDFGNTWAAVAGVSGALYASAISGTGQYQTVVQYPGFIYGSSDFGNTWAITNGNTKNWAGVSISYTGQYQTVCDNTPGYIWYSLNYGITWTQSSSPISYWTYVACSATGLYQTATSSGGIFTSADYGVTWTLAYTTGSLYWWTVALSQTGQYQLVVVQVNNAGGQGYVYTSKDYGSTWTQVTIPRYLYLGCTMSATGQYQVVCSGTNPYTGETTTNTIYISTDYGYSWTLAANIPPGVSWYNVAMSATAQYMTICTTNGGIYNSSSPVATGLTTSNVALGYYAGQSTQGAYGIAIGNAAGQFIQGISSIAIGVSAGQSNQGNTAIAIGAQAALSTQGAMGIAIGGGTAQLAQGQRAVAIGQVAGNNNQGANAVALGWAAGLNYQASGSVAVGALAGQNNQSTNSIAIGYQTCQFNQNSNAIAIGYQACQSNQGPSAVAIGYQAAQSTQATLAVAIGNYAGQYAQKTQAVSIGTYAGQTNQGSNAVAIGYAAGSNNQNTNTIVINATGAALNTTVSSSLYISPIRNDESVLSGFLHYNSTTNEIVFNAQGGVSGANIYGSTIYVSSIVTNTASISSLTVSSINGLQGGGSGPIIYASTIYVSSIVTNTASISSLTVSSINGLQGGGGTTLSTGTTYGDYLYWSGTGWAVGTSNVIIGGGAGQTNQGNYGIAIGYSAGNINQGSNSVSIGYSAGNVNQGIFATAVGYSAGNTQADGAVAVGTSAGNSNQQAYAVAVGYQAGILNQSTNAVAIGLDAGYLNQGSNAIAIGKSAGRTSQLQNTIILNATGTELNSANSNSLYIAPIRNDESVTAGFLHYNAATNEIVYNAQGGGGGGGGGSLPSTAVNRGDYLYWNGAAWVTGFSTISIGDLAGGDGAQANNAVAIGGAAGNYTQRSNAVAVGFSAGYSNQGANAIAIGNSAGLSHQSTGAIAIGNFAGQSTQGAYTVAIGNAAGQFIQGISSIAIGINAGQSNQLRSAVAIGNSAGQSNQASNAVAIGTYAGQSTQGAYAVAIGSNSGRFAQGAGCVAIGPVAGYNNQGTQATAVGWSAGQLYQGNYATAVGVSAGYDNQGQYAVALGRNAGSGYQGTYAVAMGNLAGGTNQSTNAVAIGAFAGRSNQNSNAIAIGYAAGSNNQSTNTIIINATGVALNTTVSSSLYIAPIRNDESVTSGFLHYNSTTNEIVFNAQGGGGTLIYTSTLYASSVTTATASISSLVVSSINGPGSNGNFIYNANGLLAATSNVNIVPIFQTSTVVFAQNIGSFNYLPAPANFSTNNGGVWTSSLIFANYASNVIPFPYFGAGQNTPGYLSYYTNGGQINALFSFKPSATVDGNPGQAAATVGFSTSLGYYTVGDYEITGGNRSTILYTPSGSFVFGQPLPNNSTWQVQRTSNSLVFQYSSITNNFSTVYTVNNINIYDTAQLYILNNNNYGTAYLGSWQVSALDQRQSFNVACAAQFSTLNTASASISSLSVSSIASVSLTGDIDMKLNNIKNIGSSEYSVPPFAFSIAPASTIISGSYTYFVCNSSCTVSLAANLTNVVYYAIGGGGGGGTGYQSGGGGGAGGLRTNDPAIFSSLTLSSLQYNNNFLQLINGQTYTITIGTGGGSATNGTDTTFISGVSTFVTATGGGAGSASGGGPGANGGCGGGGATENNAGGTGSQGFNGGTGGFNGQSSTFPWSSAGGGGGIAALGVAGSYYNQGGAGGAGLTIISIPCGYGGRGGATDWYVEQPTTGANATTPGSGGGGSATFITGGSGASGIFILGIPTAQIYNRRYGIISIDTNRNLVISTPTNIVLSGITGPNSNSPFVLTYNSTSGIVNYNTLPNTLVSTIAYGTAAGSIRQGDKAVAVGYYAGQSTQGANAIAIGNFAGLSYQSTNAVAIGAFAGQSSQGSNAVAIGYAAGSNNQSTNTIIINATGVALNSAISSSLYISPIRQNNSITTNALAYDTGTNEVVYNTTKTFVIDHPKDESKYLVHACLEGPEAGVYYRGTAVIADLETSVTITLPEYVDALATEFTVQVTPIYNGSVRTLNVSRISNNRFTVYGDSGEFDWHVYGRRLAVDVEPKKSSANVLGTGPYRWIA